MTLSLLQYINNIKNKNNGKNILKWYRLVYCIINLKYFYFNSDIFTQPLVLKLGKQRKLLRYLKSLVKKPKIKKNQKKKHFLFIYYYYIQRVESGARVQTLTLLMVYIFFLKSFQNIQ